MTTRFLAIALLSLAGCVSPEQQAANREWEAAQRAQDQARYTLGLKWQCESIGYKADTDPWRDCIMKLHQQAQANNAALRNMVIQQYLINQQQQQAQPIYTPPRQPTSTNCYRIGNSLQCTTQ